ncbi:PadR family transcriptional regulator [Paenibacillus thiaminolyticus]|uniref:PadR family transcriptional regulator n=1 Tax=Paenibacillus thiaminolyticus TaxID=49283 RepID=A0AAP9DTD0_PANTH|nr:PadR family transcriptional regulator [Paenibacillus thiaminolyticus]MCY9537628.1 PadR family transcriptional regulator [Paenibacillus thiaminolyticus]MCY9600741.1 PadR family transcriptional regulator [Paenibacillus thiaminolyticus]MCY9607569.1 PadR family transcriptional regulator [Paenibacillus thiaminolyticus]MCY9611369.1 PadR family transcriptional regulator [Paenibacillus thiaminolyticus]MCY9617360.1 PadR family transcriptional regulator [Paenibacillus thiaminolyticus]
MLEYIILGLLMEGPMSGYDMKKTIDSSVGLFYRTSYGSLYPALKRLANKGLLSVAETEGGRNKKEYTLLPAGDEQFVSWLAEPLPVSRNEVLLRIFFYDYLDEDTRQARLTEYENKLESEMRRLQAVQEMVAGELEYIEQPENYYYRVSVLTYGLHYFGMEKQWMQVIKQRGEMKP